MKIRTLLCAAAIGFLALWFGLAQATSGAFYFAAFPGIEKLVETADAVAIVRIQEHIQPPMAISTNRCHVWLTLKGDLKSDETVVLQLVDTRQSSVDPFAVGSTHLVFLSKQGNAYKNLLVQGSTIPLSPFENDKFPEGDTMVAKIQVLLERSVAYGNAQWQKERQFLEDARK